METAEVLEPLPSPSSEDAPADAFPLSNPGKAILAVLAICTAIIHLVMVPSHAGQSLIEGLGFAVAGWVAVGFALAVVARPSKRWLQFGILANVVFIAVWAVTRTRGLPFGAHPNHAESASFIDLTCVGLEAALIVACAVFIAKPRFGENLHAGALVMASIAPLGVLVLTTAVLASPSAQNHAGGSHGNHDGTGMVSAAGAGDHHGGAAPADDHHAAAGSDHGDGHSTANGDGHNGADHHAAATPAAAQRCDWDFNTQTFWAADPPQVDDGSHAHSHGSPNESANPPAEGTPAIGNKAGLQIWAPMTDQAKCDKMKADLAVMESMAKKYPTAQSALDAGCIQVTMYVPGIARHIACFKEWMDNGLDVNKPEMLLYGGNKPWAPLVGLSYYTYGENPGEKWVDGKMPFHIHEGLCVKGALVIGGDGSTKEECEAAGGKVMGKTGLMGHYWLPSCSSPDGVFSADNPSLDMQVAIHNDDPKFDPAAGGDPSPLYENPCAGAKSPPDTNFGPPANAGEKTESAAGPVK